jgi:hypothetical protein
VYYSSKGKTARAASCVLFLQGVTSSRGWARSVFYPIFDCPKRVGYYDLPLRSDRFDIAVKQASIAGGYFCFLEKTNQNDWVWASYRNVKSLRLEWRVKSGIAFVNL